MEGGVSPAGLGAVASPGRVSWVDVFPRDGLVESGALFSASSEQAQANTRNAESRQKHLVVRRFCRRQSALGKGEMGRINDHRLTGPAKKCTVPGLANSAILAVIRCRSRVC
jgi:hypothetical protein